ncbi:MAG: Lrp/AsnC family transcriptional regulator [Nanoarchaeota archaeon]
MADKKNSIITEKDILILKQLLEDGRKSSSCISKEIDLGREIVNYRIKRLIKENLIVKFVPKINEKALHYKEYLILLKLNLEDELSKEKFIKETIGNKYLVWVVKSGGGWDLIIRLYAESLEEFQKKLNEILDDYSDVLANYYTIISSEEIKENQKQVVFENLFHEKQKDKDFQIIKHQQTLQIDSKDKEILKLLESDARVQYKEIAEKLDISSDTAKYRIDRMKEQGIIENFMPVINLNKLGLVQYAVILKFGYLTKEESEKVCKQFEKDPNIIKAIKNLQSHEYFLTLAFDNEENKNKFESFIQDEYRDKIEKFDIFKID